MENLEFLNIRQVVSLGGRCPYNCLHCYTFCDDYNTSEFDDIERVVESLKNTDFKIVYISGHKESFVDPDAGISLCERIFEEFNTDILITTRNVFNGEQLDRLSRLNVKMKQMDRTMFFCVSIPALDSYEKLEPNIDIPTPKRRIDFLQAVYKCGIYTFLTIRPLCPNEFIPISECIQIIENCYKFSSAVIASGIVVDDTILSRLKTFPTDFKFEKKLLMRCLNNDIYVKYVDVTNELEILNKHCQKLEVPFYTCSLQALDNIKNTNYFIEVSEFN